MVDTLLRWIVSALGAAAVTGGLFMAMPSLVSIGDPEPGRALIAWQEANPPEYGGAFDPEGLPPQCRCIPVQQSYEIWSDRTSNNDRTFADFRLAYQRELASGYRYRDPSPVGELRSGPGTRLP